MGSGEIRNGITLEPEIVYELKGNRIKKIEKYNLRENNDHLKDFCQKFNLPMASSSPADFFSCTDGVVLVHLENGNVIGFAKDSVKLSVVCWFDVKGGVRDDDHSYYCRSSWIVHDVAEKEYGDPAVAKALIGKRVNKIRVMKSRKEPPVREPDANEKAIILDTGDDAIGLFVYSVFPLPVGAVVMRKESEICPLKYEEYDISEL